MYNQPSSRPATYASPYHLTANGPRLSATGSIALQKAVHLRDPDDDNNGGSGTQTIEVFDKSDAKVTVLSIDCAPTAQTGVPFTCTITITTHSNGPITPIMVGGAANVGVPQGCTVAGYTLIGQGYGLLSLSTSVSQTVTKTFQITCSGSGLHEIVGCGVIQIHQHVRDTNATNNFGTSRDLTEVGIPGPDSTQQVNTAGRCSSLDPPEVCGNGIDEDADTLVDEEPDADRDGLSNCVDTEDDGDGYTDAREAFMGTDPLAACPLVTGVHAAWPPDVDNSQDVTINDVLAFKPAVGASRGSPFYTARKDLNASNDIDIGDVLAIKPVFTVRCN